MAVELRCPDCRAKLRLPEAPDAGTEVECPKCGTVFPAPEPEAAADEDAPKKKKKPARDDADDEKPKKDGDDADDKKEKKDKKTKAKGAGGEGTPKRRKAKKNETSNVALFGVIGAGVLMIVVVAGVLIWLLGRTPKSIEMMTYLPEDCYTVEGLNLGHAQKYPKFYEGVSATFKDTEFKAAGDAIAKATGVAAGADALIDYVVFGSGKSGSSTVIRTKMDIDGGALAKLPGAQLKNDLGRPYYLADGFKGGGKLRVFAPTARLVVYCPPEVSEAVFKKMLDGHAASKDKTIGVRAGDLGKRVTKGTFWYMTLYEGDRKPPAPPQPPAAGAAPSNEDAGALLARTITETVAGAKGMGHKASIGSREVRFEWVVWAANSEKASSTSKKHQESELGKGDDGTPPRWWKEKVEGMGNKKVAAQMLANIGCGSSGELFYAKSAVDTTELKEAVPSMATLATGPSLAAPAPPPK